MTQGPKGGSRQGQAGAWAGGEKLRRARRCPSLAGGVRAGPRQPTAAPAWPCGRCLLHEPWPPSPEPWHLVATAGTTTQDLKEKGLRLKPVTHSATAREGADQGQRPAPPCQGDAGSADTSQPQQRSLVLPGTQAARHRAMAPACQALSRRRLPPRRPDPRAPAVPQADVGAPAMCPRVSAQAARGTAPSRARGPRVAHQGPPDTRRRSDQEPSRAQGADASGYLLSCLGSKLCRLKEQQTGLTDHPPWTPSLARLLMPPGQAPVPPGCGAGPAELPPTAPCWRPASRRGAPAVPVVLWPAPSLGTRPGHCQGHEHTPSPHSLS